MGNKYNINVKLAFTVNTILELSLQKRILNHKDTSISPYSSFLKDMKLLFFNQKR